jgi:K+-transporting ATPase ATPase C chain
LSIKNEVKRNYGPALKLAVISMLLCGLLFPLTVTGFAQVLLGDQANGSLAHPSGNNGRPVGSYLVAQNFSLPFFFHPRNATLSASGVDPDITLQDALSQVPRISNATGIASNAIANLVNKNEEGTFWIFGSPYMNVLRMNLALIHNFQARYCSVPPFSYCE